MPFIPFGPGLVQNVASTGVNGYTLINGTGNILTWTPPNDGNLHRVQLWSNLLISSAETGGQCGVTITAPNGSVENFPNVISAGGAAVSYNILNALYMIQGGSTIFVKQLSALTGGAAVLWAELWGA